MYVSFLIHQAEYCNPIVYMVRVHDTSCSNSMKKHVVWGFFYEQLKKVTSIRMMSKIRTSFLDSPANITLRVHFIDPRGRFRWELCSRFREMRLRARVMWMWWYRWLVEKWFNNVMEFYLLRDFIIKKSVSFEIFTRKGISKLPWIRHMLFCHRDFLKDEKLPKTRISRPWKSSFDWSLCNGGL